MPNHPNKKLPRAGIIGTGLIGPVHAEGLRRLGIPVTALCGSDKAKEVAERLHIPHVFTDYDYKALIESDEVDVVHITSPNKYHHEMALATLEAGKHCICEKPLAMNSRETLEIMEKANASKTVFAVNYNVRYYPAMLHLRGMIADGEFGDIIHVNGSYFQDWLLLEHDFNWRLLPEEGGALRAVADIGTHWIDLAAFVQNTSVDSVYAQLGRYHEKRKRPSGNVQTFASGAPDTSDWETYSVETEDYACVLLRFACGSFGNLSVSQVAAGRKNSIRLEVYGSKKAAWWDSENPDYMTIGNRGQSNQLYMRDPSLMHAGAVPFTDYPAGHAEGFPDTFKMLYRDVYRAIDEGGSGTYCFATAEDGHREILLCEAVTKSHREDRWIQP